MRRFLTSLVASLVLTLGLLAPVVHADTRYWQLDMYHPTGSSTAHTVNIEYKVLSTVQSDRFTVTLYENGVAQDALSQTTTKDYGDSGVFQVLLDNGTYTFHVSATDLGDDGVDRVKTTPDQTVTVTSPASGGTTVVQAASAGSGSQGSQTGTGTEAALAGSGSSTTTAAGEATGGGQVQGASTGNGENGSEGGTVSNGQVNAPGSNSTKKNPGKVLGIATTHSSNAIWWYIVAAIIVVLLAGYYWFARRRHTTNP